MGEDAKNLFGVTELPQSSPYFTIRENRQMQYCADRAHARTQAIEQEIAQMRAEGLVGIGVQLDLGRFINGHVDIASEQTDAAYEAIVRLTGKDCAAEARAIVEKFSAVVM